MDVEFARTSEDYETRNDNSAIDAEVVKIHYPRDNNNKVLSFSLPEEPNLSLLLPSIQIGCRVKIPANHLPENGLAMKLFKNLNIELNSQLITATKAM